MNANGEVRMSPHGLNLAWKVPGDAVWTVSSSTSNDVDYLTDDDVANWEPMVSARRRAPAEREAAVPAVHAAWDADGDFRSPDCFAKGCPLCASSEWAKRQAPSAVQDDDTPEEPA